MRSLARRRDTAAGAAVVVAAWLVAGAPVFRAQQPPQGQSPGQPPPPSQQPPPAAQQQPPAKDPQTPTFRTGTNIVRVDVTVVDGKGDPVTTLTAEDFEVQDDGRPQSITSFQLVEAPGTEAGEEPLEIRNRQHAAAEAAKDDVRVFLVFWDDYHISPYINEARARDDLTKVMLRDFGPRDLVAIMEPLTTLDSIKFTRDRRALANQVHQLKGRRGLYVPPRSGIEEAHLMSPGSIERVRCEVTTSAVKAGIAHLGALREAPNALIIVSEGFTGCDPMEQNTRLRELIQTASASHTAVFIADPRGLQIQGRMQGFLLSLAGDTGGEAFQTNDLGVVFKKAVKQASAFYLLGYSKDMPMDGKFHAIKVRVKPRGLDVRSRSGYWAPLAADVEHAREVAAAAELPPAVAEASAFLLPLESRRPAYVWTGTSADPDGRPRVTVAWAARKAAPPNADIVPTEVFVKAIADGTSVFDGPVVAGGTSFEAPPGPLQLAISVRDKTGDVVDREGRMLTILDAATERLMISTPVIVRARGPRQTLEGAPILASRDFERTDRIVVTFAAAGASARDAKVTARVLGRTGAALTNLTVQPDASGRGYRIDLPFTTIARGEYLLSIEATNGDDRAESLVAFRVLR